MRNWEKGALALILLFLFAALIYEAWNVGVTIDEPVHLLSGHLYWQGADTLRPRDVPPLMKIVGGWPSQWFRLPIPYGDKKLWESQELWQIAAVTVTRLEPDRMQPLFFYSRLPFLVFPLLIATLLWKWGRELFDPVTGVVLALMFALEPTALGHGALFKNDLAATFGYALFWYRAWRFWRDPRLRNAVWLSAALLLVLLTKMSMLFLVVVAPCILICRYLTRREFGLPRALAALFLVLVIPYLGSLATCQFETHRLSSAQLAAYASDPSFPRPFVAAAQLFRVLPVPVPMWEGVVSLFQVNASGTLVYLLGKLWAGGSRLYFLIALALKVPIPIQILLLAGLVIAGIRIWRRKLRTADLFWLVPGFLYIGLASMSSLEFGVRLVMPALPFGLLLCGAAVQWLRQGRRVAILAALVAWLGWESASIYPGGISYFNEWIGGPDNGSRYLVDSNLDWGQDLGALARYMRANHIAKVRLSYFGNDKPLRYLKEDEFEIVIPPWNEDVTDETELAPQPGYYAISATLLPGQFFEKRFRDYYKAFREMKPVAKAGYSIFIYKVPAPPLKYQSMR